MAIDTQQKRAAAAGVTPLVVAYIATGAITDGVRSQIAGSYVYAFEAETEREESYGYFLTMGLGEDMGVS